MHFVFALQMPVVPVVDSDEFFPVHRICCIEHNYVEPSKEMGATGRVALFFFMQPADAELPVDQGTTGYRQAEDRPVRA